MEYKYIAVYCKMHNETQNSKETIRNIFLKAKELFQRLDSSYADDDIKILLFGIKDPSIAYEYLPKEHIEAYDCKNIQDMSKKIWNIIRNNEFQSRIYIVLANWQWKYIEPLLKLKHDNYKFFYEGALDPRPLDEINKEKEYEKSAKVKIKQGGLLGLLDTIGSNVSTDLKG
ncbi:MAG: hypothetical protein KatS3mg003_0471 [Candidatus Nitrosocaldaceae archaeon]|nr:MAG: hypothetical protein KatS3mg003_0471 [Candidatus Nitrosocaldaceae archaeon]